MKKKIQIALALLGFVVIALKQPSYAADAGTTLQGSVILKGVIPAQTKIKMAADPMCQMGHPQGVPSEEYVVGKNGGLKNVFVYVKEGLEGKTFPVETKPATLTQEGCQYKPHVIGVQANQPLEVVNGDSTLHNVNIQPKSNPAANFAQPVQGMKTTKKFEKPEVMIPFICNVHPWMKSYVGVVPHPFFAVSGDSGQFEIKGLPAGTYVLEAWHEKMGTAQQKITVKTGEIKPVSFVFTKS
jgi:plastocyanin